MSKRFLNRDPEKDYITTDKQRFEQRVMRGVERPLLSTPYDPERGTRVHEACDSSYDVAISKIYGDVRKYIRKYWKEIKPDVIKIKQLQPELIIDFELEVIEDTTNG